MRFSPKTEKEINEANLWTPGVYDFEVLEATDTTSKNSGADMIKLKVKVFNEEGGSQVIFDYLLESMPAKLRHAAEAFGVLDEYEAGSLEAIDCEGKTGKCKVNISKDKSGSYPDKNGIADYIPQVTTASVERSVKKAQRAPVDLSDDIPF